MISKQEALQKFKDILGEMSAWLLLKRGQFIDHLSVFQSWALRDALWKVERAEQEYFLSTAINEASISAHTEDREYVPRRPAPATGTVTIENKDDFKVSIPVNQALISNEQIYYATADAVVIDVGESADVPVSQLEKREVLHEVTEEKVFYEILFDQDVSAKINSIKVWVDTGDGYEQWAYAARFQNVAADDKVFDEFFSHTGQNGVRFGNGIFGQIIPLAAQVKIELWLTDGDTFLLDKQNLNVVGDLWNDIGRQPELKIYTKTDISEGADRESGDELRTNLHYWPLYADQLVWQNDYEFYLKRKIPQILWMNVWGENEMEAVYGPRPEHINRIYVSAYATDMPDLQTDVLSRFAEFQIYNRRFEWVTSVFATFSLAITGSVQRNLVLSQVEQDIRNALEANYGKDSQTRRSTVRIKDIYQMINLLGHFDPEGSWFEVEHAGSIAPGYLWEMVHIDLDNTTVTLEYV